jgi:hypothetical protein
MASKLIEPGPAAFTVVHEGREPGFSASDATGEVVPSASGLPNTPQAARTVSQSDIRKKNGNRKFVSWKKHALAEL